MSILLAVDDGLTNANYDMADVFFLIAAALAVLSGLAYATGNVGTVTTDNDPAPRARPTNYHRGPRPSWRSPSPPSRSPCFSW